MAVGLRDWVDLAKKAPAELHFFENTYYAERFNVVLTFSAEADASGWAAVVVNQDFYARRSVALTPLDLSRNPPALAGP